MPGDILSKIKAMLVIAVLAGAEVRQVQQNVRSRIGRSSRVGDEAGARSFVVKDAVDDPSFKDPEQFFGKHAEVKNSVSKAVNVSPQNRAQLDRPLDRLTDNLVTKRVDSLFERALKIASATHSQLEKTTIGKTGQNTNPRQDWQPVEEGSDEEEGPLPLDHETLTHELGIEQPGSPERWRTREFLNIIGPGLMTCLADTDGPCLQTAASSGVQYKYGLVMVQILLIPVLYAAQELTVRLGLATKDGLTGLIRRRFGNFWAWLACSLHVVMCIQQQMGEFGCIAQLATDVWGVQKWWPALIYFTGLFMTIVLGRWYFRSVEILGMLAGSCQILMVAIMFMTRPFNWEFFKGLFYMPFGDMKYNILMASNIGAVIMPWMLYYQQSACVERKIQAKKVTYCRADTGIGAVLAQLVMLSTVVALGKTAYGGPDAPDTGFAQIVSALSGTLGSEAASKWIISIAMVGACTCASICLMVTPIWSICEIMKWKKSFDDKFSEAPGLYSLQVVGLVLAYAMAVGTEISSTPTWAVLSQVVNALLILPVAVFLWLLASDKSILPANFRLKGTYKKTLCATFGVVCAYCIFGTIMTIKDPLSVS